MKAFSSDFSLRFLLVSSFLSVTLFAVVLVGLVSFYNSRQAAGSLALQLRNKISAHIVEHVRFFLETPHAINGLNARAIGNAGAPAHDPRKLQARFQEQICLFPSVSSINFGNIRGGLINSGREATDDSRYIIATKDFAAGLFQKFSIDEQGRRKNELVSLPYFDARTRPWYTRAVEAGREVWSDIYTLFSGRDMAIAASRPVYAENGEFLGVVSVELFLSGLSRFLQDLDIGTSGLAFILEPSGHLVAASVPGSIFTPVRPDAARTDPSRLDARQSADPMIRNASNALLESLQERDSQVKNREFFIDGERYFLQSTPLQDTYGIDWLVAVVVPESDFMAGIRRSNQLTSAVAVLALGLLIVTGTLLARRIVSPIRRLSRAAEDLAVGRNFERLNINSRILEVGQLATSFNHMSEELQKTVQGLNREIQDRIQTEKELEESRDVLARLTRIIDESINIIFVTTSEGVIEYVNSTFEKITGYSRDEALGENPRILSSGETTQEEYKALWQAVKSGDTWRGVFKNRKKDGGFYWANGFISPIRNEQGEITHFMAIQEDVTEKMASRQQLQYMAEHDPITGVINRMHFIELLDSMLARTSSDREACLIQVDIDGFKLVNDAFGTGEGDRFLREFAEFITFAVQQSDMIYSASSPLVVGRLGGDEFGILLPSCGRTQGLKACEFIRAAVENTVFLDGRVRTTVSIGLVLIPQHGTGSAELLAKSNAATAAAKEFGQNRSMLYAQGDAYLNQIQSSLEEKQRIIAALDEDLFEPWFQPILHLKTGEIHHYEALARLVERDGRVLPPAAFIPTAENFGLISNIDRRISQKTMQMQADLQRRGHNLSFSLNISGKNLGDREMLSRVRKTIEDTGVDPDSIVFELTETAAIRNLKDAVTFVRALKSLGCRFSLDDFGVGFTSFLHLVEMEVDFLKIDGSFVRNLPENSRNRILVKTIADMARGLGIQTIAEFVDRKETLQILKDIGVDYAQGYYVGKPSPNLLES